MYLGIGPEDTAAIADALADKVWRLRFFADADDKMNLALADAAEPQVLVISQFTLYADTSRGRRPGFATAASPAVAEPLVDHVVARLRALGCEVATGRFGADMQVSSVNDGPVTLLVELS